MRHILVIGNNTKYPYPLAQLRQDNPETSFPENPSAEALSEFNVYPVQASDKPEHQSITHGCIEVTPKKSGDQWVQVWKLVARERYEIAGRIADRRYQAEEAGIVIDGLRMNTDDRSKLLINGAALESTVNPSYVMRWKTPEGFVDLTGEQVMGIARAVRAHVQACFDREAELLTELDAGTLTDAMLEQGWPE